MYKLRELERKDLSEINKWRNDFDLVACLGAPFRFINEEVDEKWYDAYMSNRNGNIRCAIVFEDNDRILGLVSLIDIDYIRRSAIFNIMVGRNENYGKGIGTYATKEMLRHAFYNMNLHRIELTVLSNNERAIRLYEKVGFKKEGIKREVAFKNGKYEDMVAYSILDKEYMFGGGGQRITAGSLLYVSGLHKTLGRRRPPFVPANRHLMRLVI